jgi:ankyrin repeat protein
MHAFFDAVDSGDISKVRAMCADNPSLVNAIDKRDRMPVSIRETIRKTKWVLVGEGPPATARKPLPSLKRTALHVTALRRHTDIARLLINLGSDVNPRDIEGVTPLHFAVQTQPNSEPVRLELVQLLITNGADVNARAFMGRGPLHYAFGFGWGAEQLTAIELLLENGADVNAVDENGWTALDHAIFPNHRSNQTAVIETLIRHGADVNAKPPASGQSGWLLYRAARHGKPEITRMLIEAGADVNAQSGGWGTALHAAVQRGHDKDVELLLAAGADPNMLNDQNLTPLDLLRGHVEMVELLDRHASEGRSNGGIP